jgi:hypothetical protein
MAKFSKTSGHCEPPGRRNAPPDDGLLEAIHKPHREKLDCFVAALLAMTISADV